MRYIPQTIRATIEFFQARYQLELIKLYLLSIHRIITLHARIQLSNMDDIPVTIPNPLYPFPRLLPSPPDLEHASTSPTAACPLLKLPLELRNKIYRYFVISHLDCKSHPRLWRPLSVDGGRWRIGYFPRLRLFSYLPVIRRIHRLQNSQRIRADRL